jgi:hypothetical protein
MNIQRIRSEVVEALKSFAYVEAHPTQAGEVFVKIAMQTSAGNTYIGHITFSNYPDVMPKVFITRPDMKSLTSKHIYNEGNICYLHPSFWNPGRHNLTFVLGRAAKWLNKFEVYRVTRKWPGAELHHT